MPRMEGLRVARSAIHGYGGVTTRPFRAGEVIVFGEGVVHPKDVKCDDTYALILPKDDTDPDGEQVLLDLVCQTRWFNHSCDPNSEVDSRWDDDAQILVWWIALRDIAIGEEITYDYSFAGDFAEPCTCGARDCRGVIVDDSVEEMAKLSPAMRSLLRRPRPI